MSGDGTTEIVGKKSAWQIWAETHMKAESRGQELLDAGAFTITDLATKCGWSIDKADNFVTRQNLRRERASDPRLRDSRQVWFYFPPDEKAPRLQPLGAR